MYVNSKQKRMYFLLVSAYVDDERFDMIIYFY